MAEVLSKFVCVRVIAVNNLDLAAFPFDYGLTWAVLFMNADRTIYGRYGSRTRMDGSDDVTIEGFRAAAEGALELHRGYPGNQASLAGKSGPKPRFPVPQDYPLLRKYPAEVVIKGERNNPTCMHCHEIQAAEYAVYRQDRRPVPDEVLWAWPMPDALGLSFDLKQRATVAAVEPGSAGGKAGFLARDEVVQFGGQPILSIADLQWILERARDGAAIPAEVRRGGRKESLALSLPAGWRRKGDFSWRSGTWIAFRPDLDAEALPPAERKKAGLGDDAVAIRVKFAGPDVTDKGLRKDDVIVEVDGRRTGLATFSRFLAYIAQEKVPGQKMALTVLRAGREEKLELTIYWPATP